ncbi:MAG: ATP-binding protein [Leptospiraceae bacterium]|nr:ATP-binding protein [Leptospiraceae bacterium]
MKEEFLFVKQNENTYVFFLPPNMEAVKVFRQELKNSLDSHKFPNEDVAKIELACDEALTNSISANVASQSDETIICKWRIVDLRFSLIIMDYGRGVPKEKVDKILAGEVSIEKFIKKTPKEEPDSPRVLPYGDKKKIHKNSGQGLKIINNLMDTVKILYHCNDEVSEDPSIESIEGSIVELSFKSSKK